MSNVKPWDGPGLNKLCLGTANQNPFVFIQRPFGGVYPFFCSFYTDISFSIPLYPFVHSTTTQTAVQL
jgi:hypothetical protein